MTRPSVFLFFAALLFAAVSAPLWPQTGSGAKAPANDKGIIAADIADAKDAAVDPELRRFADAASAAAARAFSARGVALSLSASDAAPAAASKAALDAGARWAVTYRVRLEKRRLFWSFAVYDAASAALRAADSFSAFAGLTALPQLDSSAESVAASWARIKDDPGPDLPVPYRLRFSSAEAGVSVRFSSASVDVRDAGTTTEGMTEAVYAPFREKEPIKIELSRDGFWPETIELKKGPVETPVRLPRLQKKTIDSLTVNASPSRVLGAEFSYRRYLVPDAWFLQAADTPWASTAFRPGSAVVLHDELRLGAGGYLIMNSDRSFRVAVGTGVSGIGTWLPKAPGYETPFGFDLLLDPFWFTLEYHQPTWAIVFEQRFPYSLGLKSGFLAQGWSAVADTGPLFCSLGVMLKW